MKRTAFALRAGLLAFAVVLLGLAASVWTPDRSVESLVAKWGTPPSQFLDLEGVRAHVRDEGRRDDPEPIVLLHGTGASLHTWDGWVAELQQEHRVIRVDLPGFGLTGPSPGGSYGIERYVRFVIALMDTLQVQRAVIAGNSLGGYVAWKTAADHPDRISTLILVDAAGYDYAAQSVPIAFRLASNPLTAPLMQRLSSRRTVESSVRNVYGDPSRVTPELVDRYYELTLREGNRAAIAARFAQVKPGEHAAQIATIRQPTLILWGAKDRLIPPVNAERFHREIRGSQLVVFDNLGHVPQEEDPAITVAAVTSFLASNNDAR
jgi:pimeloyl-ACP methyl ester carboxylesterase